MTLEYGANYNAITKSLGHLENRVVGTKRISGISDSGFGYELDVKKSCKFNPLTNQCCGNCNGKNEDCTLRRIKSKETLDKLLKPLNQKLDYDEIYEDNYELHRMNGSEFKHKIEEMKQNQIDTDLHGTIEFNNYDTLKQKEFYDNAKKKYNTIQYEKLNERIQNFEHETNVKNILDDLELYEGQLL